MALPHTKHIFYEWLSNLPVCNVFLKYQVEGYYGRLKEWQINKIGPIMVLLFTSIRTNYEERKLKENVKVKL